MPNRATDAGATICVCTYRRPSLFQTLKSFERLERVDGLSPCVVVIDNDLTDALRVRVEEFARGFSLPLRYVHAPAQNISIARNAALDAVETRWAALIDDDEIAAPDWLSQLWHARKGAEAVIGQSAAQYGPDLPGWAARCDFHSNRIEGSVANAYTSNALLDIDFVRRHGLNFRVELGRTGGEDTVFFRQFAQAGGRIAYCPSAIVTEEVPAARATMRWVRRRNYRGGQTHGLLCREFDPRAYRTLLFTAGAKAGFSALMALVTIPGTDASRRWFARAALHAGAMHYRIRPQILEEYG
ncbi:succinoglycan biosynthesis protein ExoM [Altererythrobacter atlanticus]|nr:glycosyltransferase [Croceibacterium atlanticum]MBB5731567.1 succinoglycan biosynthesis protein ExoM [Croceibacterium atlanticum]